MVQESSNTLLPFETSLWIGVTYIQKATLDPEGQFQEKIQLEKKNRKHFSIPFPMH